MTTGITHKEILEIERRRKKPPIEPLAVPEEELPPIEPVEELPPVEPATLEPAELYPLIARLYPSFPTLKPEDLPTKMVELSSLAQEDPEAFLYDLDVRATPEERDFVLRTLGVPEEYFVEVEEREAMVQSVFPDLTTEEFIEYVETDWESFLGDIKAMPRTIASDRLLQYIGFTRRDLETIYGMSDKRKREILQIGGVPEDEIKKIIELSKLDLDAEGWRAKWEEVSEPYLWGFLDTLPMRSISAGYGDLVSGAAGVAGWLGNETLRGNLLEIARSFHRVAPPVEEWDVSLKTLLDPRFWSTVVARALPFSVAMIPISLMTFGTGSATLAAVGVGTWKAHLIASIFAGASGAILESSFEAGSVWNEAKLMGWSDEDADEAAQSTFTKGVGALTGTNAIQLFAAFLPDPTGTLNNLVGRGLATVVRVGGKIVTVSLTEGGEEAIQNVIERQALGLEVEWDNEMKMAFMVGAIMGFGMGGAADVLTTITNRVSGQLPTDVKPEFDATVDRLKADGASDIQAKIEALDAIGDNREVQDITDRVVEEVIKEESIESVKPVDKTEALAWEHIAEPEAVVIPEVPEAPPLMAALMKEGAELVVVAEKIEPTNTSLVQFKEYLKQAQEAVTPEARGEALAGMEGLEDAVRAIVEPPAVEVAKPPVEPEVIAERAITSEQTESINTLAKEKLIMTEEGKTKPQLRRLMKALTGKNRINQLTQGEADLVIEAVGRLEVKYGRPPVIPTGVGLITAEFADKIPLLKEIGILEKVRPTRHVFEKMGLRQEVWKPAFEAEVLVYEEHQAFDKELNRIGKLVGKDPARRRLVFRELENPGSQVGLTFDEKRAVTWFRKYFDSWADRLNLPENKRRTNYVTHIFEEEISQQLKGKHPIDPELIKALDFITPKTVFNPYLQRRLGQTIGLREDPFAAAKAYEARALKVFYYEPLIQRIRVYQKYLPPHSARYLSNFITRITDRPLTIDRELNRTVNEFADRVRGLPGGEAFANSLTRGNPGGMISYNLTSVLYTLWLGFKPTSAIRNLGQHSLIIAEAGPINFAKGLGLRVTPEGRAALKESLVLRSRRGAFIPAIDSSFASKWTDSFREKALWMFRFADKQNVSDAFLAGYAEAKELFPNAPRELWINRGDEVAADTQYLYTKFNSFSMSQNSIGRVFSMLTTWTENWMELMTKWIKVRPSQVFLAYTKETGQAMPVKNWSQTSKAILMYMLIVGLGYALKEKTRLKAWEYTGLTSLSYLADIVGGDFPALQAPGAVADLVVGFVTDDDRRLKTGWNSLKSTFIPSIIKQMNYVATGERDWLTLLLYLEGKDIEIKRLRNKWEKEFEAYPLFKDDEGIYDPDLKFEYLKAHPQQIGWSDAKIRNQWRIDNPKIEAKMFIVGQFTVLSSDEARAEVLRLIEEHKIDTELIDGYEKVFGIDTKPELQKFQNRLGELEKLVVAEPAEYFTISNFLTEVNNYVRIQGRSKVERDGHALAIEALHAQDLWEPYYNLEEDDARLLWRQQFPDVEALLYLFGKVSSFKNPKSAEILLGLMKKYDIPPEAIRAFLDDPSRYDELFTQKFELEQKWFDQTTEYENFGNTEAPNYIEDAELRKEARAKFKEDNPNWVADMRRIEAIDNDASDEIMEKWVDRGKTIDEFGAGSSQAKVWLLDNPEAHKWALDNKLLTDDGSDWNEDVLRINVELDRLAEASEEYRKLNYKKNALQIDFPEGQIDNYIDWYMTERKDYEDDWFLMENPEFYQAMVDKEIIQEKDFSKVPTREVYAKYLGYLKEKKVKPDDWEDVNKTDLWYEDDWYLIEHPDIYEEVYLGFQGNKPRDFSKVPTRDIFAKYLEYVKLPTGKRRLDYRYENPSLDAWMVLKFGLVPAAEQKRRAELTPTEEFLEDVTKAEAEFDEAMRELEELLKGLR